MSLQESGGTELIESEASPSASSVDIAFAEQYSDARGKLRVYFGVPGNLEMDVDVTIPMADRAAIILKEHKEAEALRRKEAESAGKVFVPRKEPGVVANGRETGVILRMTHDGIRAIFASRADADAPWEPGNLIAEKLQRTDVPGLLRNVHQAINWDAGDDFEYTTKSAPLPRSEN